jgi:hypothetical protein
VCEAGPREGAAPLTVPEVRRIDPGEYEARRHGLELALERSASTVRSLPRQAHRAAPTTLRRADLPAARFRL